MTERIRPKCFARLLGCSVSTLYRRIEAGLIRPPMKDGGIAYWTSDYVETVIKGEAHA